MAQYVRTQSVDASPGADTVKGAVLDLDEDLTGIVGAYNAHDSGTTGVHGLGSGTVAGTTNTQTLTNKTLSAPTLTGTVTASGATITGGNTVNQTITTPSITGGTSVNMTIQTPTITGSVDASGAIISSPTITGTIPGTGASMTLGGLNTIKYSNAYATLAAAITAIGATETVLEITPGTSWDVDADAVVPATLSLRIQKGALLTIANTKTLTINGPFEAGLYQVFSGTGTVTGLSFSRPEYFGTPSTTTVQSAINSIKSATFPNKGGYVYISPKSSYTLASLTIPIYVDLVDMSQAYPTLIMGDSGSEFRLVGAGNGNPAYVANNTRLTGNRSSSLVFRNGNPSSPRNQWSVASGLHGNVADGVYEDQLTLYSWQSREYSTGTVDVTAGSATVTGIGTEWTVDGKTHLGANFRVGDVQGVVKSVESAISLTLETAWSGATLAGQSYTMRGGGDSSGVGKGDQHAVLILDPEGIYILNPDGTNVEYYDPLSALASGHIFIINQPTQTYSKKHYLLIHNYGAGANSQAGMDLFAGTTGKKRIAVDSTTNKISVYANDLTTPLFSINNTGAISGIPTTNGSVGTIDVVYGTTETLVPNTSVTANSIVILTATDANASGLTGVYQDKTQNSPGVRFVVKHSDPGGSNHATFNYYLVN